MSKLILLPGSAAAVTHELAEEVITIGRSPENAIQIDDPSVSGRHAQLHRVGETFHLQDFDSTNGTRVNGETITTVALHVGDRIRFGRVDACFECEVAEAEEVPEVTAAAALPEVEAKPAEFSARPADFANASPFPRRTREKDPVRLALFAAAGVAILAFLASMLSLALMQPPPVP
jgi:predicted component of type VI protein secretion system